MAMITVPERAAASLQSQCVDDTLAAFADDLRWRSLPETSRHRLKRLFLDTIGVALGARDEAHSRQALAFARLGQAAPQASLWGSGEKAAAAETAFANGVAAHGIDFDDTHRFVHPGCAIVPAAVAVAEWQKASGEALLVALAAGYETSIWVAAAIFLLLIGTALAFVAFRLAYVSAAYILPPVAIFCLVGGFARNEYVFGMGVVLVFGIIGYLTKRNGYSNIGLLLGAILGTMFENYLLQDFRMGHDSIGIFFERPVAIILWILLFASILVPVLLRRRASRCERRQDQ